MKSRASIVLPLALAASMLVATAPWSFAQAPSPEAAPAEAVVSDPGAPPKTRIPLTPTLSFGARLEVEATLEKNFDLDKDDPDDLTIVEPLLAAALSYHPSRRFTFLIAFEGSREFVDDDEGNRNDRSHLLLKQANLTFHDIVEGMTLRAGRIRFRDAREWIYDEEMDGVRATYNFSKFGLELSASERSDQDLLHGGNNERIVNYGGFFRYVPAKDHELAAFAFLRDDRTLANESPLFLGLHADGDVKDFVDYGRFEVDLKYWLEAAYLLGESGTRDIRGYGFDVGATFELDLPLKPSVTLAYAFGSGDDDPLDGKDRTFRQTGLQENESRFNGVRRFNHYGVLLEPELSNLRIFTAGVGIRPTRKSTSLDVVYHHYRQDKASDRLRVAGRDTTELDEDPFGIDEILGEEIDVVAAYRSGEHVDGLLSLGFFKPGEAFEAFGSRPDDAFFAELELRYEF